MQTRRVFFLVILAVLSVWLVCSAPGCVYNPNYDGIYCAPGSAEPCPNGFTCEPDRKICVKEDDTEPGPDGDGGTDADDDGGEDGGDDGGPGDGDDGGPDDGDDGGPDDGDDGGPADLGPCGGCSDDEWCDEADGTCKACDSTERCGSGCVGCQAGENCIDSGADGFCCQPECGYPNACSRLTCNDRTYLCMETDFNPLTYAWIPLDGAGDRLFCALSDQDGILDELYQCNPQNAAELLYFCPWGGSCNEDGTCQPDVANSAYVQPCGSQWGCDVDHCQTHLREGESCLFNYDCESFCCSRDAAAVCLDGNNRDLCKISTSLFIVTLLLNVDVFEASGEPDPHDLSAWVSYDSNVSPICENDQECDSGLCRTFYAEGILEDRCELASCVNLTDVQTMRDTYFCEDLIHEAKINGSLWPVTPQGCTYEN